MSVSKVLRGSFWLYLSSIINNLSGFFYWLIISAIAGSRVLGITTAIAGFASLINGILNLGVGTGSMRFFGKAIGANDRKALAKYFWSSFFYTLVVFSLTALIVFTLSNLGIEFANLKKNFLKFASFFIILGIGLIPQSLINSLLRTDIQFLATIVGSALKFTVGVGLVLNGWDWVGAVIGYLCPGITSLIISLAYSIKKVGTQIIISLKALKEVIKAGIVSWIPSVVAMAGQWLGVLFVFGNVGAVETGHYFVAFAIANVVTMVGSTMTTLMFPVLSGMADGRKRVASRVLNIGLTLTFPIIVFVLLYPWLPLSLLGKEYVLATSTLLVLLLSVAPNIISGCVGYLVYAYGYYNKVLMLGLISNIPRVISYYLLTPKLGGLGAAISFTLGSYFAIIYAVILAREIGFKIDWNNIGKTAIIPSVLGLITYVLKLPWFLGAVVILTSIIAYLRLGILTKTDLREISRAFWLEPIAEKIYLRYKHIIDVLIG